MADQRIFDANSNLVRFALKKADTGKGITGLTSASAGLIISTIADNEAAATAYTVTGATIETITTLGTYAAPTATKCRFKEVDPTNHPGLYECQFADARFSVASSKRLVISVSGATNLLDADYEIELVAFTASTLQAELATAAQLAAATLDSVVLGTYTFRQILRALTASAAGVLSGAATTTVTIKDPDGVATRIVATVDASGNRSAVTLTLT